MKTKHPDLPIETQTRGAGRSTGSIQYTCHHCGITFSRRATLDRHVRSVHTAVPAFHCDQCGKGCTRSINMEMPMRTCTGAAAVAAVCSTSSSTPAHRGGAASSTPAHRGGAAFTVRRRRRALGGAAEVHTMDMNEADQFATLEGAVLALEPTMAAYQRRYRSYKFQIAVDVMSHKAVDPAVVTQPTVTLRCEMAAVYADGSPQLGETARHLLELIDVCEHNGSGWVFSSFVSLQLTLWQLDPLRAGAFGQYQNGFGTSVQSPTSWALGTIVSNGQCLLDCILQLFIRSIWRITWNILVSTIFHLYVFQYLCLLLLRLLQRMVFRLTCMLWRTGNELFSRWVPQIVLFLVSTSTYFYTKWVESTTLFYYPQFQQADQWTDEWQRAFYLLL